MEFKEKNKFIYPDLNECTVAIIGLGYVGLPLAVEFAKKNNCLISGKPLYRKVIGFDINLERLKELKNGLDQTNEISKEEMSKVEFFDLTSKINSIARADVFIISVPTPIDKFKNPDLTALKQASITVGKALKIRHKESKKNKQNSIPIIILESTVFPGTTEEICMPLIEEASGLFSKGNKKFFDFGYSPERINPGDKEHTLVDIKKITSGNNKGSSLWINKFYGSIIKAGTHIAESIKVAEAAKIIENTQRDLNIALVNEFAIIFKLMNIDTLDVINAASSKWNFLPFKPGLVGGHCIGVDPYYLTYKSKSLGYYPEVVLAGRKINDNMGEWIAEQIILEISRRSLIIKKAKILLLGLSFKENCSDIRNTKVVDIINCLNKYDAKLTVVDPLIDIKQVKKVYDIKAQNSIPKSEKFNVIICTLAHKKYLNFSKEKWEELILKNGFFFDLKGFLPRNLDIIRP